MGGGRPEEGLVGKRGWRRHAVFVRGSYQKEVLVPVRLPQEERR